MFSSIGLTEGFVLLVIASTLFMTGAMFMQLVFVHNVIAVRSRHLFSLVFTISGLMFFAVLLDVGTSLLQPATTTAVLTCCLGALLGLVVVVLPFLFFSSIADDIGFRSPKLRLIITVAALIGVYSFADTVLPNTEAVLVQGSRLDRDVMTSRGSNSASGSVSAARQNVVDDEGLVEPSADAQAATPSPTQDSAGQTEGDEAETRAATTMEALLARSAFFGVVVMASLGGYAAVATPRAYLQPFWQRHSAEKAHSLLAGLTRRHAHVIDMWATKQRQIALQRARENQGDGGGQKSSKGMMSWLSNAITGGGASSTESLMRECDGLSQVSLGLYMQINDAAEMKRRADSGKSAKGMLFASFGLILSLYCVSKMLWTTFNLMLWRFSTVDPVTRFFQICSAWVHLEVDVAAVVSRVALTFNICIILSAMRGFLITTFRVTTQYVSMVGANSTVLFFSLAMGLYFIAMLLLMRLSLPEQHRSVLTDVIGRLPFYYYHRLNDAVFVLSCAMSMVLNRYVLSEQFVEG